MKTISTILCLALLASCTKQDTPPVAYTKSATHEIAARKAKVPDGLLNVYLSKGYLSANFIDSLHYKFNSYYDKNYSAKEDLLNIMRNHDDLIAKEGSLALWTDCTTYTNHGFDTRVFISLKRISEPGGVYTLTTVPGNMEGRLIRLVIHYPNGTYKDLDISKGVNAYQLKPLDMKGQIEFIIQ